MSSAIKTVCFGSTEAHREVSQLTVAKENPRNSLTENHLCTAMCHSETLFYLHRLPNQNTP